MIEIADYKPCSPFARELKAAIDQISSSRSTRRAYWLDVRHWLHFCERTGVDVSRLSATAKRDKAHRAALVGAVTAFVDDMTTAVVASTTRVRRIAALSSMYERLRLTEPDLFNPFSPTAGPKRERGVRERPTPPVEPSVAERLLAACAADPPRAAPQAKREEVGRATAPLNARRDSRKDGFRSGQMATRTQNEHASDKDAAATRIATLETELSQARLENSVLTGATRAADLIAPPPAAPAPAARQRRRPGRGR